MDNLRDIRNRISSVQKTMKITNAMYLMASSKLKKARKSLEETEPYFNACQRAISRIIVHTDLENERFFSSEAESTAQGRHAYIVITSDRGLAGSYNHNVCRVAEEELRKRPDDRIFCVGQAGYKYFARHPELSFQIDEAYSYTVNQPSLWRCRELADHVIELFMSGDVNVIHVVYTEMVNALATETRLVQLLPLRENMFPDNPIVETENYVEMYDPSPSEVLRRIIPNYVKGILYSMMVESYAAEQNARMSAMDNATNNAKELIAALSLEYNRIRQAAITTQITEIVSGANAQIAGGSDDSE